MNAPLSILDKNAKTIVCSQGNKNTEASIFSEHNARNFLQASIKNMQPEIFENIYSLTFQDVTHLTHFIFDNLKTSSNKKCFQLF